MTTQEIIIEANGEQYTAVVGAPIARDDLSSAAFIVGHSSQVYAIFFEARGAGRYVARPVVERAEAPAFETVGEQLAGRELEKERRGGQQHFKPGQHHAVGYVSAVGGELEFCARLTYVDWMGHACVVICVLGEAGTWSPILMARAGQTYQEQVRPAPTSFKLSEKMLDALGVARTQVTQRDVDVSAGGRQCRECGCTDNDACDDGCYWAEDDLCSACAPEVPSES